MKKPVSLRSRVCGVSLVEVLVTIVILAIGLLGLASLQMTGLKTNRSAYLRSQASFLAYDITERMRANRDEALSGSYDSGSCGSEPDCDEWADSVTALLGADATGAVSRSGGNTVEVTISWNDNRGRIKGENDEVTSTITNFVYRTEI